jgi:two-component system chemotaxis sensor kinase CheA
MTVQDVQGLVEHVTGFLQGMPEHDAAAARTLRDALEEVGEILDGESHGPDRTKVRKASVLCDLIAGGGSSDPDADWTWVRLTCEALGKVIFDGVSHEDAGYPGAAAAAPAAPAAPKSPPGAAGNPFFDAEIFAEFLERQSEELGELESAILSIESGEADSDYLMRVFHTLKGESALLGVDDMSRVAHATEDMLTAEPTSACSDRLLTVIDWLDKRFKQLSGAGPAPGNADDVVAGLAAPAAAPADTSAKNEERSTASPDVKTVRREAMRVDAARLDLLIEHIGELVIAEAMVSQSLELREETSVGLAKNVDRLDKICRELQEIGLSLRMIPVRPVFRKMKRLVRDLSRKSGRPIKLTTQGEDTELDRSVVEMIGDPLVHLLRNAVDHGIEKDPIARLNAGKDQTGAITLTAYHRGGNIVIEVEDDGCGLDRDAILAKAVERGLVREGQALTDREIHHLIFEPGFSTADTVTDVSGRGVGMDVVRRSIEQLRGGIEIESSSGRGTKFRINLPLTLAIIDGMVVKVGTELYIVPTLSVVRLVRPAPEDLSTVRNRGEMLRFEEDLIPLFRLDRLFEVDGARQGLDETVVVIVESEGRRLGLMTDDLEGQQQIVIKSLGDNLQGTPGLAGGAIMSDGNVAVILDVAGLVKVAHEDGANPAPGRFDENRRGE